MQLLTTSELNRVLTKTCNGTTGALLEVMTKDVQKLTFDDLSVLSDELILFEPHTELRQRLQRMHSKLKPVT